MGASRRSRPKPRAAHEPAVSAAPEPPQPVVISPAESEDTDRPRRSGWWSKRMLGKSTDAPEDPDARTLNQTMFAQPALFTIEYATARVWQTLGITPDAFVGHSMGDYVAACLAGVSTPGVVAADAPSKREAGGSRVYAFPYGRGGITLDARYADNVIAVRSDDTTNEFVITGTLSAS